MERSSLFKVICLLSGGVIFARKQIVQNTNLTCNANLFHRTSLYFVAHNESTSIRPSKAPIKKKTLPNFHKHKHKHTHTHTQGTIGIKKYRFTSHFKNRYIIYLILSLLFWHLKKSCRMITRCLINFNYFRENHFSCQK